MKFSKVLGGLLVSALTLSATAYAQETVGNALVDRPVIDTASGSLFVLFSSPFTQPGTVTSWGFYNDNPTNIGRLITPVIFQSTGVNQYVITGIGATRTNDGSGVQNFGFSLVSGSAQVDSGFFFGWKDGSSIPADDNVGVAEFTEGTGDTVQWFGANVGLGETQYNASNQFARTYSLQANTVSAAPEPVSLSLLAIAALPMVGIARRRKS